MDMQGDPIGGNRGGTKHTTDPDSYQNPVKEGAGAVASDSLAAESAQSGGAFGKNRDSNPQSVPGHKSTFANTDTSGATTLPPARDAQSRDEIWNETGSGEKYPEGAGGQGQFPGSHAGGSYAGASSNAQRDFNAAGKDASYNTSGSGGAFSDSSDRGPSADKISTSGENYASSASGPDSSTGGSVPTAPGYVADVTQPLGQAKPKGKNVTEGSEEDFKGPNTQDAEIGSENDPGRRAEDDFRRMAQQSSGSTAPKQGSQDGNTLYSDLKGDQEL